MEAATTKCFMHDIITGVFKITTRTIHSKDSHDVKLSVRNILWHILTKYMQEYTDAMMLGFFSFIFLLSSRAIFSSFYYFFKSIRLTFDKENKTHSKTRLGVLTKKKGLNIRKYYIVISRFRYRKRERNKLFFIYITNIWTINDNCCFLFFKLKT